MTKKVLLTAYYGLDRMCYCLAFVFGKLSARFAERYRQLKQRI